MNTATPAQRIEVLHQDLRHSRLIDDPHAPQWRPLADGEARLRVDSFGLSSNNITYAAIGESIRLRPGCAFGGTAVRKPCVTP